MRHAGHVAPLDGDRPGLAVDVAVGTEKHRALVVAEVDGEAGDGVGVLDLLAVVEGHHVVGAPVARIHPHAWAVDVADGGLEGRLRRVAERRAHEAGLLAVGLDPDLRVVELEGFADVSNARHRTRHLGHRLGLGVEQVEVVVLQLDHERSGIPVGEDARHQASRRLEHLYAGELAAQDGARVGGDLLLLELARPWRAEGQARKPVFGATFGLASRLRCSCGIPTLVTTMSTVPGGSSLVSVRPIRASSADACCTEMPGAKRTEIISIDSSISGKKVDGRWPSCPPAHRHQRE